MKRCPKCNSKDVEIVDEVMQFVKCKKCGFNELEGFDESPEERNNQREKTQFNPYKTGGARRGKK